MKSPDIVDHQDLQNDIVSAECHDTIIPINDLIADARRRAQDIEEAQSKFPDVPL